MRAQTHKRLQILVCAHGCTDGTQAAVRELARFDPRIRLVDVPRVRTYPPTAENHWYAGPVAPLNAGLAAAHGDWIARIDDDDEWFPDHVDRLLEFARAGRFEFVSSAHEIHADGDIVESFPYYMPDWNLVGGCQTWLYRSYLRFFRYNPDCWRKAWNKVNDTDLQDRMWRAGVRMGYLPEPTCRIRPRPGTDSVGMLAYTQDRAKMERTYAF